MNVALRRRWLLTLVQPSITVRQTAPADSGRNYRLSGTPALVVLVGLAVVIVLFLTRFFILRRQAKVSRRRGEQAEAALAESETRYRLLFDHNPCAMYVYDPNTSAIIEANDTFVTQYGYSRSDIPSLTLAAVNASGSADGSPSGNTADSTQHGRHVRKDGTLMEVETQEHPLALAHREARLVVVTDVTERRAAEAAAREAEAQARTASEVLQSLFDVAPQAILVVDARWHVTQWNRAAEQLFGWTATEVIGRLSPFLDQSESDDERLRRVAAEMTGYGKVEEVTRRRRDGTDVDVLLASAPLVDSAGQRSGSIAVFTDLTERKLLEEQLRQSQKMEAIGTLAGGIAHDFNNILTVITSYSSTLIAESRNEHQRTSLEEIATAAKRATELTRQLLTFSRKAIVRLRPVDVNETVHGMRAMLRRLLSTNIDVITTLAPGLGFVVADPGQLEQIMMNLAVNAADAMPDGGTLVVETRDVELNHRDVQTQPGVRAGSYVMLALSDTGTGMDAATMSKIFEPFFTTKEVGKGTGLGLATVYAIVNQLGGHVRVFSELGHGTTFKIYLPRDSSRRSASTPLAIAAMKSRPGTILLVEDDEPVRRAVRRMLERFGHTVLEAEDGESGLSVATSHTGTIDAVVTDLMMPRMNGRAFAAALEKARPGLPVVFTSGYTDDAVLRKGLTGTNHTFLQKPFTGDQLAQAISALVDPDASRSEKSGESSASD